MIHLILAMIFFSSSGLAASSEPTQEVVRSAASSRRATSEYVHEWVTCPAIDGYYFNSKKAMRHAPKGDMHVVVFYASWCIPCQNQVADMLKLEKEMKPRAITFSWLFVHDLQPDIRGFARAHKVKKPVITTKETVKAYHNPGLPAVYICDRNGWLLDRMQKMEQSSVQELRRRLDKMSGY